MHGIIGIIAVNLNFPLKQQTLDLKRLKKKGECFGTMCATQHTTASKRNMTAPLKLLHRYILIVSDGQFRAEDKFEICCV